MNNWRLLLLALVAVAQPIGSFTESIFIDGREQCCDRKSRSLSEDSRASIYGTTFTKPTSAEYRLNQRDDIREDHRHRLKHYNIAFRRAATESSPQRNRERESLRDARSTRDEHRFEVPTKERIKPSHDRTRTYRATKDINFNKGDRRIVREHLNSQNDKIAVSSQLTRHRLHSRTNHVYERLIEASLESRPATRRNEMGFQELIRAEPGRETRHIIRRIRHETNLRESTSGASMIRQQAAKDLMNALQEEGSIRIDNKPTFEINNGRRVSEQRLSTRMIAEAPDKRIRFNAREKKSGDVIGNTLILIEQHQQRENMGVFRDNTNSFQRSQKTNIQKVASFTQRDNAYVRSEQNNENRRALRDVTTSRNVRENQNERIILNFREYPNDEGFRAGRSTGRMENNSRRKTRTTMLFREDRRDIRDQERRFIRDIERRSEVMSERIKDIRSDDRRSRERNSENRRESREIERITENRKYTINNEISFRDLAIENQQTIGKAEKHSSNRNSEMRRKTDVNKKQVTENGVNNIRLAQREEKVRENQRDIRKNERLSRDRRNEGRKELRSAAIKSEFRTEDRSEKRSFTDTPESITENRRKILDNTRHSRVRERRDFRSTERMTKEEENRNTENKFKENRKNLSRERQTFVTNGNQRKMKSIDERKLISKLNTESKNKALERYNLERRARSMEIRNVHKSETQLSQFDNSRDVSRIRIKSLNNNKRMEKEIIDRNVEYAINRMNMISTHEKDEDTVNDTVFTNWQYVFYTMQGIYLCSLIMKAITPDVTNKAKSGNWWILNSPGPVKVD